MSFPTSKVQALLIYLAVEQAQPAAAAVRREQLTALLWPDILEASARQNLRQALYLLRQEIPAVDGPATPVPLLLNDRHLVQLNPDARIKVDVAAFEDLLRQGSPAALEAATALYRGSFLADFQVADSNPFEVWASGLRASFSRQALTALDTLAAQALRQRAFGQAEKHARRQLELDPLRESACQQLMLALAYSGQRSAALQQYELCRRLLADELGVEPSAETAQVYEQIRAQTGEGSAPPSMAPAPLPQLAPQPPPGLEAERHTGGPLLAAGHEPEQRPGTHNLPAQSGPLIGRETELATLSQFLAKPDKRLITLIGMGGSGKTRLALAVAEQQAAIPDSQQPFSNGVCFVPLAPISEVAHLLPALAQALDIQLLADDRRGPEQQVLDFIRRKRMLLIFDNFEHLLDGTSLITAILQAAGNVKILATSREPLRLYEEQVFPLDGLPFSETMASDEDAAVQLFLQRARRARPDFDLRGPDRAHLTTICRQVGGMPLALELAAAWVDTLSLAEIANELRQSLDLLETAWRNLPLRHRSMRAVFDVSWQRLSEFEQRVFSTLSVFRGGFSRQAARQVCGPEIGQLPFRRTLAALVGKSFVSHDLAADRYDLHDLLRQYAAEKLAQPPAEEAATRDRHSAAYCALAGEHTRSWHTAQQLETLETLTRECDNIHQAWRWALAQGEWQRLALAIDSWMEYHEWHGRYVEAEALCRALVAQLEARAAEPTPLAADLLRLWARALTWIGAFAPAYRAASGAFEQGLALLERPELAAHDTRPEKALALLMCAVRLSYARQPRAREFLEQSMRLFQELNDSPGLAQALTFLGAIEWRTAKFEAALTTLAAALAICEGLGDQRGQSDVLQNLALVHKDLGHLDKAEQLNREALRLGSCTGQLQRVLRQANLANTLWWLGKFEEAAQVAGESLAQCQDMGHRHSEGYVRGVRCFPLLHLGHYREVRRQAAHALPLLREYDNRPMEALVLWALGGLALAENAYGEAQTAFAQSAELLLASEDRLLGVAPAGLGYAAYGLNDLPQARRHLAAALASALNLEVWFPAVFALPGVALLLAAAGDVVRAVEVFALAGRHPFVANSKWFEDVAGRELARLAAALPPAAAEAARERGQALELWETAAALRAALGT